MDKEISKIKEMKKIAEKLDQDLERLFRALEDRLGIKGRISYKTLLSCVSRNIVIIKICEIPFSNEFKIFDIVNTGIKISNKMLLLRSLIKDIEKVILKDYEYDCVDIYFSSDISEIIISESKKSIQSAFLRNGFDIYLGGENETDH